jgi:hypothetical protein
VSKPRLSKEERAALTRSDVVKPAQPSQRAAMYGFTGDAGDVAPASGIPRPPSTMARRSVGQDDPKTSRPLIGIQARNRRPNFPTAVDTDPTPAKGTARPVNKAKDTGYL